ncbi:hypothetical protein C9374_013173 [Naegleria lovaniensis]|uniref:diaminopimelate epimerase n=1 Tax=Naegleria lovaniensis TaxID=51637 RepID=A0AA88GDX5_NAELO|nr:uncharacterized protein C9374_013173 [Naegleria lovaniensis]KAG2372809.1 hypothetical protein C9374_013173 [Naegleria lovaniensis]
MAQQYSSSLLNNDLFSFCKMHGLGNDYLYMDCCFGNGHSNPIENDFRKYIENLYGRNENHTIENIIQKLCHRNFGIGADGVIFITKPNLELLEKDSNFSQHGTIHCQMEMYNSDGSSGEMCGNGLRCVAQYACDRLIEMKKIEKIPISQKNHLNTSSEDSSSVSPSCQYGYCIRVQSNRGRKVYDCICYAGVEDERNKKLQSPFTNSHTNSLWVEIEMGPLQTKASNFDMASDFENPFMEVSLVKQEEGLIRKVLYSYTYEQENIPVLKIPLYCLLVPNPHAICFVNEILNLERNSQNDNVDEHHVWKKDVDQFPLTLVGPVIENDREIFPQRTNVEFIELISPSSELNNYETAEIESTSILSMLESNCVLRVRQRTWERGSGETNACGTGAFAVSQLVYLRKFYGRRHDTAEQSDNDTESPPLMCTVQVQLNGGDLYFKYDRKKQQGLSETLVNMVGPVSYVCNGTFRIVDFL